MNQAWVWIPCVLKIQNSAIFFRIQAFFCAWSGLLAMPDCGTQTWLSMPCDAAEWEIIEDIEDWQIISAAPMSCSHSEADDDILAKWGDHEVWPPFPANYFGKLGQTHVRYGHKATKCYKYEVKQHNLQPFGGAQCFLEAHVEQPLNHWLAMRYLTSLLAPVLQCGEMPLPGDAAFHFTKFTFCRSQGLEVPSPTTIVWHGTYFNCLARILHTGALHASDLSSGLGFESHVSFPAIYTADTMQHALRYAFPTNLFGDNLYYSVLLELEVSTSSIVQRRRGEVLIEPHGHLLIRHVYVFFNVNISQGSPRCQEWNPQDELLPCGPLPFPAGITQHRRSAWWTSY